MDVFLNKLHNLSEGDYQFSSDVGEFNNRFKIVFKDKESSIIDDSLTQGKLKISELPNGNIQFSISGPNEMSTIEIIDLLGRTIYHLEGQGTKISYPRLFLNKVPFIAKVTLNNGKVLYKKSIKIK
jgi:hypothetical protein